MSKQAWSRTAAIRGAAAVVLTAMMPVAMEAGGHSLNHRIVAATSHQVATFGATDEGSTMNKPDPTEDGFIIIECVVFDGHAVPNANAPTNSPKMRLAAVPRHPLGPSKCRPWEYQRT
jgi:hypothetical protein